MYMQTFRTYEQDLFHEDSIFIQYSNDPARFLPPIGYVVKHPGLSESCEPRTRECIASDYEIDLAGRAYDKLFAHREFSFHGMQADLIAHHLARWKNLTIELLEQEYGSIEHDEEHLNIWDIFDDEERGEIGLAGLPTWSGSGESNAEDIAWKIEFGNKEFDLDDLRPDFRMLEIARWRAEIVRLSKEDHQKCGLEQTVNKLNKILESDQGEFETIDYSGVKELLEQLEISLLMEIVIDDQEKFEKELDGEILVEFGPELNSLEDRKDPQTDFGKIVLGEELHILFSDTERGIAPGDGRYEWERVDESDKSDDRNEHSKPNERIEQSREDEHGEHDGHSR